MSFYNIFNATGTYMLVLYNFLQFRKKKDAMGGVSLAAMAYFRDKQPRWLFGIFSSLAFWLILETYLVTYAQYLGSGVFNSMFSNIFNTGANYFGPLMIAPLMVVLLCWLLRIDPLAQMDMIAPSYPLALTFVKIACHFGGCCRGFEWENGMYNPVSRLVEFPSQLLESGVALLLFLFLFFRRNKFRKGRVFPIYLTTYSALRFFTEFTRVEPPVFLGLKTYQFLCIAGVLVGLTEYFVVCKYGERISQACVKPFTFIKKSKEK